MGSRHPGFRLGTAMADLATADGDGVVVRYQIPGRPGVFGLPAAYQP